MKRTHKHTSAQTHDYNSTQRHNDTMTRRDIKGADSCSVVASPCLRVILPSNSSPGYTLVETLIGLFIFLAITVPLSLYIYQNKQTAFAREQITAMCLLEQEARRIQVFPNEIAPVKRKMCAGKEWQIKCETRGEEFIECRLSAERGGREFGYVILKVYP